MFNSFDMALCVKEIGEGLAKEDAINLIGHLNQGEVMPVCFLIPEQTIFAVGFVTVAHLNTLHYDIEWMNGPIATAITNMNSDWSVFAIGNNRSCTSLYISRRIKKEEQK